jgi:hypothetical protein
MRPMFPVLLAMLPGCAMFSPQWEGVWFLDVPTLENADCDPVIDENFDDAEVPEFDFDSDWTVIDETTLSNSAYFVEIVAGKGNQVFAILGDEVFPGTADKNLLQVSWTGTTDATYSEEHDEGYEFSLDQLSETTTKMTLVKGEKGLASGTYTIDTVASVAYAESDRWRPQDVGLTYSQMPSSSYLTGDAPVNIANEANCANNDCELTIDQACSGEVQFAATFAGKYENGMFDTLKDAAQSPGGGGITIVPPTTTWSTTYTY